MKKSLVVVSLFLALSASSFAAAAPHKALGKRGVAVVSHGVVSGVKATRHGLVKAFHFLVA